MGGCTGDQTRGSFDRGVGRGRMDGHEEKVTKYRRGRRRIDGKGEKVTKYLCGCRRMDGQMEEVPKYRSERGVNQSKIWTRLCCRLTE